jgi:hypothetical protein
MMEFAITCLVAVVVVTFWSHWGWKVMAIFTAIVSPAEPAPQRVQILRPTQRNHWNEWELDAQYAELEADGLLAELKAELEARDRQRIAN